jgi:hypothetical protein
VGGIEGYTKAMEKSSDPEVETKDE